MALNWSNWARTARATPTRIERPASTAELADVVRRAVRAGEHVRPVGGGISSSAIAAAPEVMIDTKMLRGLHGIDRAAGTATFGAGTRASEAAALLEAEGLALMNPTSNADATLAGAVSTGSHGSSLRLPSSPSQLVETELVTGTGDVLRVGERKNAELWPAVRLSLGALGIMSEVTVRTVAAHRVAVDEHVDSLSRAFDGIQRRAAEIDYLSARWMPHTGSVTLRAAVNEPGAGYDGPEPGALAQGVARVRAGLRIGLAKSFPQLVPTLNRAAATLGHDRTGLAGPVDALRSVPPVPHAYMAYTFPIDVAPDLLPSIADVIGRGRFTVPSAVLVTFAPGDDAYLSTSYNRPSVTAWLSMPTGIDPRPYFHAAEEMFLAGGGLPHWGGYHTVRAAEFKHVMPRFGDFATARHRLDPDHRLTNAHL
ncbi:MAG: D-arabinono-1,4-lactone oxidase, partial [Pseudoclavibacter sp.]